jgi:hypothetical protein
MSTKLWHYSEKLTKFITTNSCIHGSFPMDKKQCGRWYRYDAIRNGRRGIPIGGGDSSAQARLTISRKYPAIN